ncbi:hypothetical protein OB955_17060 [Halobacteria archaeon AArc-m2/3/4]|uniref:Uncharacterized protein n=1 Tax=Natronoglomus mannanivorans TaxID=2979990 RepID=A0ABT2QHM5_9EURY|nr:hypothetical protein [Halobacteria archaeon AArc-m2/3/4]
MSGGLSRRSLVGLLGSGAVSGCLGNGSDSDSSGTRTETTTEGSERGEHVPDECDFPPTSLRGRADPIETTVEIERLDDSRAACATIAAKAALEQLAERLDLELTDRSHWVSAGARLSGERHVAEIRVRAERSTRDGEPSYHLCPDPRFDFDDAVEAVPREVTVTILVEGEKEKEKEKEECSTDVRLVQEQVHLDSP